MRKVLLATPAHSGTVHVGFVNAMLESINLCATKKINLIPVFIIGDALVQRARNDYIAMAIEHSCDDIIFMDSDQVWDADDIVRLLEHPVDVVGYPVIKKSLDEQYNVKALYPLQPADSNGLLSCSAIGTGCLRLSKHAFTTLWNASEEYTNSGKVCKMVFEVKVVDGELHGEDISACEKWRQTGGKVYADTTRTLRHIGNHTFVGDFGKFYGNAQKTAPNKP